jgi:hypothetical protein
LLSEYTTGSRSDSVDILFIQLYVPVLRHLLARVQHQAGLKWLKPVIPATQEAESRRITVQSQPKQIIHETLSQKTLQKNRAGGVAKGEGPEFKPQYYKKKKRSPTPVLRFPNFMGHRKTINCYLKVSLT